MNAFCQILKETILGLLLDQISLNLIIPTLKQFNYRISYFHHIHPGTKLMPSNRKILIFEAEGSSRFLKLGKR